MAENLTVQYTSMSCAHDEHCQCDLELIGKGPMQGFYYRTREKDRGLQYSEASARLASEFKLVGERIVPCFSNETEHYLKNFIQKKNVVLIQPPLNIPSCPESVLPVDPDIRMRGIMKNVDRHMLPIIFKCPVEDIPFDSVWDPQDYSLVSLIYRQQSAYWHAYGTHHGRMTYIAAQAGLYPHKFADAIGAYQRHVNDVFDVAKGPLAYLNLATDYMYSAMGITEFQTIPCSLDFSNLDDVYLGSSSGIHSGPSVTHELPDNVKIKISPNGKKAENFEADINKIFNFLVSEQEFEVFFSISPKNENFFDKLKLYDKELYERWESKLRLFIIPTSTFVLAEKLVSKIRMLVERGKIIQIGRKWSWGGAQFIAHLLGLNKGMYWDPVLVEGDIKNFDQSVNVIFVRWYMSTMLIHENPKDPDYLFKQKIVEYLAKNLMCRLTRLFSNLWAQVIGGVPSGIFNTSHMDSWIMALYVFLFLVWQLVNAQECDKEELETAIHSFALLVYGDDHLWNKGFGLTAVKFSGTLFAQFMKEMFDVTVRDIYDGIPLCSKVMNGQLVSRGACFLRHFFVENPYGALPGQADVVPFRETFEYISRAVHGRETKNRDLMDVLLSVIGHAYGTYASNKIAYDTLHCMFKAIITEVNLPIHTVLGDVVARVGDDDIRKLRQMAITVEDVLHGFPKWETLVERNTYKPSVHETLEEAIGSYEDLMF